MLKKMRLGGIVLASLLAATGCQNEEIVQSNGAQGQAFTLVASKGIQSRTELKGDQTVWSVGDKIYVSSKDGKTTGVLTLSSEAGLPNGTFTGFVFGNPDNLAYSVYPAPTSGTTLDLGEVIGGGQLNAPMIGAIDQDADVNVQFGHAGTGLWVNLPLSNGQEFTITAKNGSEAINLAATADITKIQWNGNIPSLTYTSNETSINVTEAKGSVMYIPFYTNAESPTQVTFYVDNTPLNTTPINLTQNGGPIGKIIKNNILTLTYDEATDSFKATSVPEENEIQISENQATIPASAFEDNSEYINIPAIESEEVKDIEVELPKLSEEGQSSVISFDEVAKDATITIKEDEDDQDEHSIEELTVILPSGDAQVEIDMPNTTVTIVSSDGDELVIEEVIVGTADETFIVKENVYIKKLTVKRGNVEVYGRVDYIGRPTNYVEAELPETVYVYVIDNGKVGSLGEGVSYASNMNGVVSSAEQLMDALNIQAGDRAEITLGDNITLTEAAVIPEGTNVTINLNEKTITGNFSDKDNETVILNNGTLKLVGNGTIQNTAVNGASVINNTGKLVLEGVTIQGAPIADGAYPAYALYTSGTLVVEEGTVITSDRGAINLSSGAEVTINGGNINVTNALGTRALTAHVIYASGSNSKLTINDGNFAMNYAAAGNTGASVICPAGAIINVYGGNFSYAGTVGQSGIFQNYMGYGAPVNVYGGTYNDDTVTKQNNLAEGYKATKTGDKWIVTTNDVTPVSDADELATAVANGATNLYLMPGEYDVKNCAGKTLTINGTKDAVLKVMNEGEDGCDYAFGNGGVEVVGNITFNGLTINTTANTGNYKGYAYMKGTFNECNFVGAYSLNNANDFVFNNCTFDFKNGYFWTWGANSVVFEKCVFEGNSKAILAHGWASTNITIRDCEFNATEKGYANGGKDWTAAVEIDPAGTNTYTIKFEGNNIKSENYAGWTRIKDGSTGHSITGIN